MTALTCGSSACVRISVPRSSRTARRRSAAEQLEGVTARKRSAGHARRRRSHRPAWMWRVPEPDPPNGGGSVGRAVAGGVRGRRRGRTWRRRCRAWWRGARASRSSWRRSSCPIPGPARPWSGCRRAASATRTCTTARAASTTSSRSCSGTRRPASSSRVGDGVTEVAPGRLRRSSTGGRCAAQCRACRRGRPWYCFNTHNATQRMTLEDGTELSPALGIGAFVEKTLVHAGQCTKVDPARQPGGGRPARAAA